MTIGSGSITVNNAKGKDINITDSSGETATYNFTRTVSNPTTKSYIERYLFEDNNLGMNDLETILDRGSDSAITTNSLNIDSSSLTNNKLESIAKFVYSHKDK